MKDYDVIICGAGPAGLTAAIYSARANLKTLIIEKNIVGGLTAISFNIENYPGFENIDGFTLCQNMLNSALKFGAEIIYEEITNLELSSKKVRTNKGTYLAKAVIICLGVAPRKLNIKNEDALMGKGISFCATCDGNFFKNKDVAVVGGGNSAFENALYLSKICRKVYLIHRSEKFNAYKDLVSSVKKEKNVEFLLNATIIELFGSEKLEQITILKDNSQQILKVDGLFISIGYIPNTLKLDIETDKNGYVITDEHKQTSVSRVFAAGDIRQKSLRQIVTACSDGAIAATTAFELIHNAKKKL
ncbi:MAG: thioredoxin-disulfide reductase [Firmicutes bacterium]|jgi:thioredoxin reductase (NADPH)|nr:thioredoxin-disulfide reductase [Bacillota bacterium]